jgi:hypothetical protein
MCGYLLLSYLKISQSCTFFYDLLNSWHFLLWLQGTVCDVREGKDVKALVEFARDELKHIDIWVCFYPSLSLSQIVSMFLNCCHRLFFSYIWPFVLFTILVQVCKFISHVSIFFSDKTNHNKIYDIFLKKWIRWMAKLNSKSQRWQQFKNGGGSYKWT